MNVFDKLTIFSGKQKPSNTTPEQHKIILIVEDEAAISTILGEKLKEEGFDVELATNGQEGLALAARTPPDLIILDLLMPVMDGKQMLRELRTIPQCKTVPVIVLTNAGTIENVRETQMYSDADEFLVKSNVTMDEIVKKVKAKLLAIRLA